MKKKRNLRPNMKLVYFATLASVVLVVVIVAIGMHASSERAQRAALRDASIKRCIDIANLPPIPASQPQAINPPPVADSSDVIDKDSLKFLVQNFGGTYGGNGTSTTLQRTDPTNWCERQYDQTN